MKKFDSINVIPFIDILLVLLAIVLTTSTFIAKGIIPIDLPDSSTKINIDKKSLIITIKNDGKIYYDKSPITLDQLKQKLQNLKKESIISINCDKSAKFDYFVDVLDIVKNFEFDNVSIITEK